MMHGLHWAPGFQLSSQDGKAEGRADILQNDATRVGDQAVGLSGCDYSIVQYNYNIGCTDI